MAYTTLRNADIRTGNLRIKYDVIFLPGVGANSIMDGVSETRTFKEYAGGIGDSGLANLKAFVEAGGTLVLMDESSGLGPRLGLPVKNVLAGLAREKFFCPGSVLRTVVDTNHPLGTGMDRQGIAYFASSQAFEVDETPRPPRVVARYADESVLLSGFLEGESYLKGKPCLLDWEVGLGHVVMFGFPVQHRGETMATFGYMWNAMGL